MNILYIYVYVDGVDQRLQPLALLQKEEGRSVSREIHIHIYTSSYIYMNIYMYTYSGASLKKGEGVVALDQYRETAVHIHTCITHIYSYIYMNIYMYVYMYIYTYLYL